MIRSQNALRKKALQCTERTGALTALTKRKSLAAAGNMSRMLNVHCLKTQDKLHNAVKRGLLDIPHGCLAMVHV